MKTTENDERVLMNSHESVSNLCGLVYKEIDIKAILGILITPDAQDKNFRSFPERSAFTPLTPPWGG
jgi:hypothetical protein